MLLKIILTLYNLALVAFLLFQGVRGEANSGNFLLVAFLLPAALYFVLTFVAWAGKIRLRGPRSLTLALSLVTVTLLFLLNLLSAANSTEYAFAFLLLPLPLYFWGSILGRGLNSRKQPKLKEEPAVDLPLAWEDQMALARAERTRQEAILPNAAPAVAAVPAEEPAPVEAVVADHTRRDFLKRIGGLGLGLLAYSLLNPKQAGAAFFGSVPGPGTVSIKDTTDTKIDPALKGLQSLTTSYGVSEIDDDGSTLYYGFVNANGGWYILKETEAVGEELSYRYAKGDTDFSTNWGNRKTTLSYQYFDQAF